MPYTYDYPRPMLTADCVVVNPAGEVLLIRRGREPFRGYWALPGGFFEEGETIEHCAVRELEEETGIVADEAEIKLVGVFSRPGRDPRGTTVTAAYLVQLSDNVCAHAGDDAAEARWFPLGNLPELAFDHSEIIAAAIAAS